MTQIRHKDASQENFPVGKLIRKDLQAIVQEYYQLARFADDIADDNKLKSSEKIRQLDEVENIFLGFEKKPSSNLVFVQKLGQRFKKENLSTSLITDLLKAFRQDAQGYSYQTWGELVNYCTYSAAPVGRFMLAIHNENPSTYLPATALCVALQIVNHLQDAKYDFELLGRIYIPDEYAQELGINLQEQLQANVSSPELKKIIAKMLEQLQGLLKDAKILPRITKDWRLKMEIGVILSLTNSMIKRIYDGDVLANELKLSKFDWCKAFSAGLKTVLMK